MITFPFISVVTMYFQLRRGGNVKKLKIRSFACLTSSFRHPALNNAAQSIGERMRISLSKKIPKMV